jgi:hypothetical protein
MAGFEVILYGRFWVITEGAARAAMGITRTIAGFG